MEKVGFQTLSLRQTVRFNGTLISSIAWRQRVCRCGRAVANIFKARTG